MKKILNAIFSMKVALIILALLIVACIFGSIIPQGYSAAYYSESYSSFIASLINTTGLGNVFHVWWFIVLAAFLCLSLLGCNLLRIKDLVNRWKSFNAKDFKKSQALATVDYKPDELFKKMGYQKMAIDGNTIYAIKNKIGIFGAWLTHLGILIIIVGFALGQIYTTEYSVYGVVGDIKEIEDTTMFATINDFTIGLRDDETVTQYTTNVTIEDIATGEKVTADTSVNYPAKMLGYKVYQNSTGWAATICFLEDDEPLECNVTCVGEIFYPEALPELAIYLNAFYPDYDDTIQGTASSDLNNPAYLYRVYYNGQIIGMNILTDGDYISLTGPNDENYKITFSNPQQYTLLQLKKDPYTWITAIGGVVIMVALLISFYMQTSEMYAEEKDGNWNIYLKSKKTQVLLNEKLLKLIDDDKEI